MLHFSGYEAWPLEEIKKYHAPEYGRAAGHPEIEFPGIEVTTGPLGQGIANAVGLAVAGKNLAATYNRPDAALFDSKVWCFTGDGCLQEGVGQEAISLAGHWALDNLVLIYDNNGVTVDGKIDSCFTDDSSAKLAATGWHVIDVYDGSDDVAAIVAALQAAKEVQGKPVFINIRTTIGIGSANQGKGKVHGQALGEPDVANVKRQLGLDPEAKFAVPAGVYEYWADTVTRGAAYESEWNALWEYYQTTYPAESKEIESRLAGKLDGWQSLVPPKSALPTAPQPTRKSSGIMVEALAPLYNSFMVGSADLLESTFVSWKGMREFQAPSTGLGDYAGRQIRYGIREFGMVAIANGIAAFHKGMFLPVMSTFFMFWLYAAPAARMSALQHLRFIGIATHDSIGIGEDGPTHQPVALASFYRALPNLNFIRPADAEEVIGAWQVALEQQETPSLLVLSRQAVPLLDGSRRDGVAKGGYVIYPAHGDAQTPDLTLLATGSEVSRAVEVARKLETSGLAVRVVSLPDMSAFDAQPAEYRRTVIPSDTSLVVAIEAWASYGWARYAHAGCHMHTFGISAPQDVLFEHFGFGVDNLAQTIQSYVRSRTDASGAIRIPTGRDYDELLSGFATAH